MWECPDCGRRFGRERQGHECAPAMSLDEYLETGPEFEPPIVEAVQAHFADAELDVWVEPVSVGVFFKRRSSFVQLRTKTKWVAVCFQLNRRLDSRRLSRKVIANGNRFFHVVNVKDVSEIDDELRGWLTEAWFDDE